MDTLNRDNRGTFEVRTVNTVYLIELLSDTEAWVTRFPKNAPVAGALRRDGDRLPVRWLEALNGGPMLMELDEVDDYPGYGGTLRGPTSTVTDISEILFI